MRLLKSSTRQLEEFFKANAPRYAILSHTWGQEEVTFQEMCSTVITDLAIKSGFQKILQCCKQSMRMGIEYTWIDTCCINNDSSAELSEAINSMYRWYQNAEVCFVYLADVHTTQSDASFGEGFTKSRWFTRGWCLQELIAPRQLFFFNSTWARIGTKSTLHPLITETTGIDRRSLLDPELSSVSIARRMSWASKRQTTRLEDVAYCLLGIFDVNMPLLYGEGEKAFIRLQEEIMKEMDDHSICAWRVDKQRSESSMIGILAKHPSYFLLTANIEPHPTQWGPYSITNKGIQIQLPLLQTHKPGEYLGVLGCHEENDFKGSVGLLLRELEKEEKQYVRYHWDTRLITAKQAAEAKLQTIFLSKRDKVEKAEQPIEKCWIRTHPGTSIPNRDVGPAAALPKDAWNLTHNTMHIRRGWPREQTIITYTRETEKSTRLASAKDTVLAFAVALQLFPLDHFATVSLHSLQDQAKAEDESLLGELLVQSQTTATSATARLESQDIAISAIISVEAIRGQRVFVLDVDMEEQNNLPGISAPGFYASYPHRHPHRHPAELKGQGTISSSGAHNLRFTAYPVRSRRTLEDSEDS